MIDSLSELRLLAQNPLRYRRQVLALKHFFANRNCTVVLLDDLSSSQDDLQLHSIAHGVVMLEQLAIDYGAERRRLRVVKMRGIQFRGGFHDFTIEAGRLADLSAPGRRRASQVLSRRAHAERQRRARPAAGRRSRARHQRAADRRGRRRQVLARADLCDHRGRNAASTPSSSPSTKDAARSRRARETLGLPLEEYVDSGLIRFQQIDPAELSPGEFAANVRRSVEVDNARVVVIDSLNGYLNAMPDERFLILQMHELLTYLGQQGVLTILVLAQHGLVGPMDTPLDISYLSDAVLMLRYFEIGGTVRRALSVVKKRSGEHEHTIREFRLGSAGIKLGPPLREFSGIFSGTPQYTGNDNAGRIRRMSADRDQRVLVFAPIGRDGPASAELFRSANLPAIICRSLPDLGQRDDGRRGRGVRRRGRPVREGHGGAGGNGSRTSRRGPTCPSSSSPVIASSRRPRLAPRHRRASP